MKRGRGVEKARNFVALESEAGDEIPGLTSAERN
jgi:hypothetical protein